MRTLQTVLFYAGWLIITPVFSIIMILGKSLGYKFCWSIVRSYGKTFLFLLRIFCGIKFQVVGRENLPDQPAVFLVNHQSAWETIALPAILPAFIWVLKQELLATPFVGWALKTIKVIGINRKEGTQALRQILEQGKEALQAGLPVLIFPEGTRCPPGQPGEFQASLFQLAKQVGVGIVPIVHNAGVIWSRRQFAKKPGVIKLVILPMISAEIVETTDRKKMLEFVRNQMVAKMQEL
jgi:1-acyl-sn-glycerol-3-phosphate acyltransferase